jgi:hypothetical protein
LFWIGIVKYETRVFLQNFPVAFSLQFINDVVGWRSNNQRRIELDGA